MKELVHNIHENVKKLDYMSKKVFKGFFYLGVGILLLAFIFYPHNPQSSFEYLRLLFFSQKLSEMGLTIITEGAVMAIISDVAIKNN